MLDLVVIFSSSVVGYTFRIVMVGGYMNSEWRLIELCTCLSLHHARMEIFKCRLRLEV